MVDTAPFKYIYGESAGTQQKKVRKGEALQRSSATQYTRFWRGQQGWCEFGKGEVWRGEVTGWVEVEMITGGWWCCLLHWSCMKREEEERWQLGMWLESNLLKNRSSWLAQCCSPPTLQTVEVQRGPEHHVQPLHQLFLGSLLGPADLTLEVLSVPVMKALFFLSSRASGSEVTQSFLFWRNNILSRVAPTRSYYNPWCCWHYHHCKVSPSLFFGNILSWDSTVHTFSDVFCVALLHWVCIQEADVQAWDQTLQVGVGAEVYAPLTLAYSRFSFFLSTS